MVRLRIAPVVLALLVGGARSSSPPSEPHAARFSLVKDAAASPAPTPKAGAVIPTAYAFAQSLRMERWEEALRLMDAEPPVVQQRPEVRYAMAAAAERTGHSARVVSLLAELEKALPLLADRIREKRARAALAAEIPDLALEYYRAQPDADSQLRVAESLARLGDHRGARAALGKLLAKLPKRASLCEVEAPAHALLSKLSAGNAPTAITARELRWLALSAPLCASAAGADERLEELGPAYALGKRERLQRTKIFADAGLIERTERELDKLAMAKGPGAPDGGTVLALRGTARYNARQELDRAVELLLSAAALLPERKAELQYTAARAHVRAGELNRAIELYDKVRKQSAGTGLGELAEYKRAQALYSVGRFAEAVQAYDAYFARYKRKPRYKTDAEEERAIAWLMTGNARSAANLFASRVKSTEGSERARFSHLEAVAWLKAGERARGEARLKDVVRDYPLSFAGIAAVGRLEALGSVPPIPPPPVASDSGPKLRVELPPVAMLLHKLGLDREAEHELGAVERKLKESYAPEGGRALCSMYQRLASAERCFRAGQRVARFEDLFIAPRSDRRWVWDCIYPRPYAELVERQASARGLDADLIYAVMRQESAFRPEVVSPAQAVGLLQILPSTGERLAQELGLEFTPEQLLEPPTNVRLGSAYLRKLLDVFDGNLPLAIASYNAGPTAVLRWLEGGRDMEVDLFVARIPYAETRSYVERVIANYARYRYLEGGGRALPRLSLRLPTPKTAGVEIY